MLGLGSWRLQQAQDTLVTDDEALDEAWAAYRDARVQAETLAVATQLNGGAEESAAQSQVVSAATEQIAASTTGPQRLHHRRRRVEQSTTSASHIAATAEEVSRAASDLRTLVGGYTLS